MQHKSKGFYLEFEALALDLAVQKLKLFSWKMWYYALYVELLLMRAVAQSEKIAMEK